MHKPLGMMGHPPGEAKRLLQLSVINFIFDHLASWRDDPTRPQEVVENKLTSQLCAYLSDKAEYFSFHPQEPQKGRSTIDFSAKPLTAIASLYQGSIYTPVVLFEGKRLPCPDNPHVREKEYIFRSDKAYGGIQRFKNENHGAEYAIAGMIGYIQENDIMHFYGKINEWISELAAVPQGTAVGLTWNASEQLQAPHIAQSQGVAKLESTHGRLTRAPITLYHLWVCMNHCQN